MANVTKNSTMMLPPKRGWVKELAEECKVNYNTVRAALYHGVQSEEAERVRARFKEKYPEYATI